jgi:putative oxidoreductase
VTNPRTTEPIRSVSRHRLELSLVALRLTVFIVMLVWTLDKFLHPDHAAGVFERFYFLSGLGSTSIRAIGAVELVLIIAFVLGLAKRWTYGAVLVLHAVSTLASVRQYLDPFDNLLFFAAWPMLAACLTLYLLRHEDTRWTLDKRSLKAG